MHAPSPLGGKVREGMQFRAGVYNHSTKYTWTCPVQLSDLSYIMQSLKRGELERKCLHYIYMVYSLPFLVQINKSIMTIFCSGRRANKAIRLYSQEGFLRYIYNQAFYQSPGFL